MLQQYFQSYLLIIVEILEIFLGSFKKYLEIII